MGKFRTVLAGANARREVVLWQNLPCSRSKVRFVKYAGMAYSPRCPPVRALRFPSTKLELFLFREIPITASPETSSSVSCLRPTPAPSPNGAVESSTCFTRCPPPARFWATISEMYAHCFVWYELANRGTSADSVSPPKLFNSPYVGPRVFRFLPGSHETPTANAAFPSRFRRAKLRFASVTANVSACAIASFRFARA